MPQDKWADYSTARQMFSGFVDRRGLMEVAKVLRAAGDEQSVRLMSDVEGEIIDRISLDRGGDDALGRMMEISKRGKGWSPALLRNNIFKAANSLGLKLPSAMFASDRGGLSRWTFAKTAVEEISLDELPGPQAKLAAVVSRKFRAKPVAAWGGVHGFIVSFSAAMPMALRLSKDHLKLLVKDPVFRWIEGGRGEFSVGM